MKLEYITKSHFDFIKDNLLEWFNNKLEKDPDTIFQFSSDLTSEDRRYIYQNSDNFIIDKNKILEIDTFEKVDTYDTNTTTVNNDNNYDKTETESDVKYEIIMRAGRKYYNKLQKYPIHNMGTINIINNKLDIQMKLITGLFCMNMVMFSFILNK